MNISSVLNRFCPTSLHFSTPSKVPFKSPVSLVAIAQFKKEANWSVNKPLTAADWAFNQLTKGSVYDKKAPACETAAYRFFVGIQRGLMGSDRFDENTLNSFLDQIEKLEPRNIEPVLREAEALMAVCVARNPKKYSNTVEIRNYLNNEIDLIDPKHKNKSFIKTDREAIVLDSKGDVRVTQKEETAKERKYNFPSVRPIHVLVGLLLASTAGFAINRMLSRGDSGGIDQPEKIPVLDTKMPDSTPILPEEYAMPSDEASNKPTYLPTALKNAYTRPGKETLAYVPPFKPSTIEDLSKKDEGKKDIVLEKQETHSATLSVEGKTVVIESPRDLSEPHVVDEIIALATTVPPKEATTDSVVAVLEDLSKKDEGKKDIVLEKQETHSATLSVEGKMVVIESPRDLSEPHVVDEIIALATVVPQKEVATDSAVAVLEDLPKKDEVAKDIVLEKQETHSATLSFKGKKVVIESPRDLSEPHAVDEIMAIVAAVSEKEGK